MTKEVEKNCFCIDVDYDGKVQIDDFSDNEFIEERFHCQVRNYQFDEVKHISSSSFEFSSDDNGNINENFFTKF